MEHAGGSDTNFTWCTWNGPQKIGRVGNLRKNQDQSDYSTVEIGWNTEKSPGDLRRLAVIQTPVKTHQLMLV